MQLPRCLLRSLTLAMFVLALGPAAQGQTTGLIPLDDLGAGSCSGF